MYTRHTELRKLSDRDEYNLATKLDERDVRQLMEIIPHRLNAQQCSNNGTLDWQKLINKDGRKYSFGHFESIKNAFHATGGTRLVSQIFLDEWKTSGRKEERPTLGVLLQLLIAAECWMAADFLATELLKEKEPVRPITGPSARFDFPLPEICQDVEDYLNDMSGYPNTTDLEMNVNGFNSMNNNQDYRTKFIFEKDVPNEKTNERDKEAEIINELAPLVFNNKIMNNATTTNTQQNNISTNTESAGASSMLPSPSNIPLFSILKPNESTSLDSVSQSHDGTVEKIGTSIPNISLFSSTEQYSSGTEPSEQIRNEVLPQLRELHIDCDETQRHEEVVITGGSTSSSSISNNEEINNENDLEYVPNLSIFEQNSSNNESSLTSVTGTSGENSFEMNSIQDEQEIPIKVAKSSLDVESNQSELISQDNIPCLSALKQ